MKQLILLYWGCVFLVYLSQIYYPTEAQLEGRQTGRRHFMLRRADIFMMIVIAWMTCFSFLRTSYNDSPLSSKKQKIIADSGILVLDALFQLHSGHPSARSSVKQ